MMSIPFLKIVAALLLLVVPGYLLLRFDMQLLQRLAKTIVRMAVQMAVVAGVLWALWRFDSPWLCLLWIVVLSVVVAWMLLRRARLPQTLLLPVVGGLLAGVLTVGSYVLLVVLRPEHALSARWMIPVAAVLLAHMLATNVRGVSAYFESLRSDSASYYTQLGNGKSRLTALTPYVRQALRSMVEPAVASLSVMGLFALPMLLSGLLLGGLSPVVASLLFLLLVLAVLASSLVSLVVTLWLSDRFAFNKRGELL